MRARFVPSGPARQVHAPVLDTLHAAGARTVVTPQGSDTDTFDAGRRRGDFPNRSNVRTHAQSRAELKSSRARVPYMAGGEFSPATVVRPDAPQWKRTRSLAAYGYRPLLTRTIATIV